MHASVQAHYLRDCASNIPFQLERLLLGVDGDGKTEPMDTECGAVQYLKGDQRPAELHHGPFRADDHSGAAADNFVLQPDQGEHRHGGDQRMSSA